MHYSILGKSTIRGVDSRENLFRIQHDVLSKQLDTGITARQGTMGRDVVRSRHADPPGRLDSPMGSIGEEPERAVHTSGESNDERIKECEEELQNRWEAIVALREVVMKQRAAIRSLEAEREDTEPTFPLQEIREETASKTSTLSGSDSGGDEPKSTEEANRTSCPTVSYFDPSHQSNEEEEEMSAITCEDEESSMDSSDFLKMEYEMQIVIEAAKAQAQAASPVDTVISFEAASPVDSVISFEKLATSPKLEPSQPEAKDGIKCVVESIQEQASHVDAAIALDKLQTTKNELQTVTSNLRNRSAEVGELKNQVKALENQIATLELERDLHVSLLRCENFVEV